MSPYVNRSTTVGVFPSPKSFNMISYSRCAISRVTDLFFIFKEKNVKNIKRIK